MWATVPTGALKVVEKDAAAFEARAVESHLLATRGEDAVLKMKTAQHRHKSAPQTANHGDCPSCQPREIKRTARTESDASRGQAIPSELNQWPTQLHLVPPDAAFFQKDELVVLSTCGPVCQR